MFCPKCNEGIVIRIQFKRTYEPANMCNECRTVWFEGESISSSSGMPLEMYSQENGYEYTIEEIDREDFDQESVRYVQYK